MAKKMVALIVGSGPGLSASLARRAAAEGMSVALAARNTDKLGNLCTEIGAKAYPCDATHGDQVDALFDAVTQDFGIPNLVIYNPSGRVRGPIVDLDRDAVLNAIMVSAYGGFLVGQKAAQGMLTLGGGTILFTGATASVKAVAKSASFAMGKFALRGLAQSMARELQPQNIHIGHFIIDGGIGKSDDGSKLDPDAIAETYFAVHHQDRSAWTWEMELRPFVEVF